MPEITLCVFFSRKAAYLRFVHPLRSLRELYGSYILCALCVKFRCVYFFSRKARKDFHAKLAKQLICGSHILCALCVKLRCVSYDVPNTLSNNNKAIPPDKPDQNQAAAQGLYTEGRCPKAKGQA